MTFIVIGLIISVIILALSIYLACEYLDGIGTIGGIFGILSGLSTIVFAACLIAWKSSSISAEQINKMYGTSYTTYDLFWSGDTIKSVIQCRRSNTDLSGTIRIYSDNKESK